MRAASEQRADCAGHRRRCARRAAVADRRHRRAAGGAPATLTAARRPASTPPHDEASSERVAGGPARRPSHRRPSALRVPSDRNGSGSAAVLVRTSLALGHSLATRPRWQHALVAAGVQPSGSHRAAIEPALASRPTALRSPSDRGWARRPVPGRPTGRRGAQRFMSPLPAAVATAEQPSGSQRAPASQTHPAPLPRGASDPTHGGAASLRGAARALRERAAAGRASHSAVGRARRIGLRGAMHASPRGRVNSGTKTSGRATQPRLVVRGAY